MSHPADIVVIKFGSGILTQADGMALDDAQFDGLVAAIAELHRAGLRPVVVSSGAAAAGMLGLGFDSRPSDLATLQACCAVGQTRLMHHYETRFRPFGLSVAQLLLTNDDFITPKRGENVKNTLRALLDFDAVIPIINENDSVATRELKLGDNDTLSSRLAILIGAKLLVLLTSIDGLTDAGGELVERVSDFDAARALVRPETGTFSVGGMATKLDAACAAAAAGIPTVIANGRNPGQLRELVAGNGRGTRFEIL